MGQFGVTPPSTVGTIFRTGFNVPSTGARGRGRGRWKRPRRRSLGSIAAVHQAQLAMLGRGGVQHLRGQRLMPRGYKEEEHRAGYVYVKQTPGEYYEIFKKRNGEADPLMMCSGRKQEIGDNIQMCMGLKDVHVVIYNKSINL